MSSVGFPPPRFWEGIWSCISVIIKYLCLLTLPTCNVDVDNVDIITSGEITNVRFLWSHNVLTADSYLGSGCLSWCLWRGLVAAYWSAYHLIRHLVYVLCHTNYCVVVHHFRMSCDKAALTHFCQLNVSRVNWTWLRLELIKHFNFTPNNKAAQEHH